MVNTFLMIPLRQSGLLPKIELCLEQRQHLFPRQAAKTSDQKKVLDGEILQAIQQLVQPF